MRWISSLIEKPVHHHPRILAARINPPGVTRVHSVLALCSRLFAWCLRESCIRENRTCSLSGGRRPARKRASSDPTAMNRPNNGGPPLAEGEEGRPLIKENTHQSRTHPTQSGARVSQRLVRVRPAEYRLAATYPRKEPYALMSARTDLCGGCQATGIPTATG